MTKRRRKEMMMMMTKRRKRMTAIRRRKKMMTRVIRRKRKVIRMMRKNLKNRIPKEEILQGETNQIEDLNNLKTSDLNSLRMGKNQQSFKLQIFTQNKKRLNLLRKGRANLNKNNSLHKSNPRKDRKTM